MQTSKAVEIIDKFTSPAINQFSKDDFEYLHYHDVIHYAVKLGEIRGLDVNIARCIAMVHDMGRIIGRWSGKAHALKGAEIVEALLKEFDFPIEWQEVIVSSILHHRKKMKIHGPYQELIKDADCLAHQVEFGYDGLDVAERVRCNVAFSRSTRPVLNPEFSLDKGLKAILMEMSDDFNSEDYKPLKKGNIHRLRIRIRRVRSLIWLTRFSNWDEDQTFKSLNHQLKTWFKAFERLRIYQVTYDMIPEEDAYKKTRKILLRGIKGEKKALKTKFIDHHMVSDLAGFIDQFQNYDRPMGDLDLEKLFESYHNLLKTTQISDMDAVHKLRIFGKRIMYLHLERVFFMPSEWLNQIELLHKEIGLLNDLSELESIIKFKTKLMKKEQKAITGFIHSNRSDLNNKIEMDILKLSLLMRPSGQ